MANTIHLMEMERLMNFRPNGDEDKSVWMPNRDGVFSINTAWHELSRKKVEVKWHNLVWHKNYIPQHSLVL